MKSFGTVFSTMALLVLILSGCQSEISVTHVGRQERLTYGITRNGDGITQSTTNLLANFLLTELYEEDPRELIRRMQQLFEAEPRPAYLAAIADVALNLGVRNADTPDEAAEFFLSAALYSYAYLVALDQPGNEPYNADRIIMIRVYNTAITELYDYLYERKLHNRSNFTLLAAGSQRISFDVPEFRLPRPAEEFEEFLLCADYRPENMTHVSRSFGLGAPLIARLNPEEEQKRTMGNSSRFADNLSLPATLVITFEMKKSGEINARLHYLDTREYNDFTIGKNRIPLELDYSTPLAYMVRTPLPFNYLFYMLYPDETRKMQGLYLFEPYRDDRIPVVFVHGLMSNTRTWIQMINTLQSDPDLRKNYQFWGFTYSSGNPVILSARMLRESLLGIERELQQKGFSLQMFHRMVLVGHSMGGLVGKTTIMNSGDLILKALFGEDYQETIAQLPPDQQQFLKETFTFQALPFVSRVVFLAVPHRGSEMAQSSLAHFGASLIKLPQSLTTRGEGIIGTMMQRGHFLPKDIQFVTGIENLDPNNRTLKFLQEVQFVPTVPYHSIMGNVAGAGIPGGSDGIVPYTSSHLNGARSELVVRSGHSVQQNPLAIQEMRRILLDHLREYSDLTVKTPELPLVEAGDSSNENQGNVNETD